VFLVSLFARKFKRTVFTSLHFTLLYLSFCIVSVIFFSERGEHRNVFHSLSDWMNAFSALTMVNGRTPAPADERITTHDDDVDDDSDSVGGGDGGGDGGGVGGIGGGGRVRVVLLDNHDESPLDEVWTTVFATPTLSSSSSSSSSLSLKSASTSSSSSPSSPSSSSPSSSSSSSSSSLSDTVRRAADFTTTTDGGGSVTHVFEKAIFVPPGGCYHARFGSVNFTCLCYQTLTHSLFYSFFPHLTRLLVAVVSGGDGSNEVHIAKGFFVCVCKTRGETVQRATVKRTDATVVTIAAIVFIVIIVVVVIVVVVIVVVVVVVVIVVVVVSGASRALHFPAAVPN
jgi:hypothetical protein